MKIRLVRAKLVHAHGQIDKHEQAKSRFAQFCEST